MSAANAAATSHVGQSVSNPNVFELLAFIDQHKTSMDMKMSSP
jgi:hypothetical protein